VESSFYINSIAVSCGDLFASTEDAINILTSKLLDRENASIGFKKYNKIYKHTNMLASSRSGKWSVFTRPILFDFQQEVSTKILEFLISKDTKSIVDGRRAALVTMPTGAGKTRTCMLACLRRAGESNSKPTLWLAPSLELVDQAINSLERLVVDDHLMDQITVVRGLNSSISDSSVKMVFATVQAASRNIHMVRSGGFGLLVFDEVHQAVAKTYLPLIESGYKNEYSVIGLTATPGRTNQNETEELHSEFSHIIYPRLLGKDPIKKLIECGVSANIIHRLIPRSKKIITTAMERRRESVHLSSAGTSVSRFWSAIESISASASKGSSCIVFAASLLQAVMLESILNALGYKVAEINHSTPNDYRQYVISGFKDGFINIIINQTILATGFDCPGATDAFILGPINSAILWEQMVGRISRGPKVGGVDTTTVWDFDSLNLKFNGRQSYRRFL
jgi:DNA repair protein RadD